MSSAESQVSTESVSPNPDNAPEVAQAPSEQDKPATQDVYRDDMPQDVTTPQPETEPSRREDEGKAQVRHITSCVIYWRLFIMTTMNVTVARDGKDVC